MIVLKTFGCHRVIEIVETNTIGWETSYNVQNGRVNDNGEKIWETIAMFLWDDDAFTFAKHLDDGEKG